MPAFWNPEFHYHGKKNSPSLAPITAATQYSPRHQTITSHTKMWIPPFV